MILDAITGKSSKRSTKQQNFTLKCNVQSFMKSFIEKAEKVNPVGSGGVRDCQPVIDFDRKAVDADVREFLQTLFDGEDSSACHY